MAEGPSANTMQEFMQYIDEKFEQKFGELEELNSKNVKSNKPKESEFRYKGNRKQYEFNDQLLDDLERLKKYIKRRDDKKAKDTCNDLIKTVERRQKCIRMADKSVAGWGTVQEYLTDEVASDSEDEKKIRQAEKRALEKMKLHSLKRHRPNERALPPKGATQGDKPPPPKKIAGRQDRRSDDQPTSSTRSKWARVQCFKCNRFGHTSEYCYARTRQTEH